MLLEEVEQFRKRYILTGEPPPPDGKASYSGYLKQRFKSHGAELVASSDEVDIATEALIAIKRDEKRLEDDRKLAEQVIKTAIGENAGVRTAHGIVTWKSQRSGKYPREGYARRALRGRRLDRRRDRHVRDALRSTDHRVLRTPTKKA